MDKFKSLRQTMESSLTRIYNACVDPTATIEGIKVRVERAEVLFRQYENVQQDIDELSTTAEQRAQEETYRVEMEEKYFAIKSIYVLRGKDSDGNCHAVESQQSLNGLSVAVQALMEHQGAMSALVERMTSSNNFETRSTASHEPSSTTQHTHGNHELRLPQIQIPQFDGKYTDWIRFRDLFKAMIHSRSNISNVEKLEYLQTKVTGEALSLVKHLQPTNSNYEIAWQLLKKKFEKSDNVKKAYFEFLFDHSPMKSPSLAEAKRVYNTINESINALKVLSEPVHHWDSVLLFNLEKKLDAESHVLWYRGKKPEEVTTFTQFFEFLERRVFELEGTQRNASHSTSQGGNSNIKRGQSRAFTSIVQSCILCGKAHLLFNCHKFKEFTVEDRRKLVQRNNICFNCLQPNHRATDCKRSSCRKCNAKHNTLLHQSVTTDNQQSEVPQQSSRELQTISVNSSQQLERAYTLLPTAIIMVFDSSNNLQACRALLDSGSQGTLVSEACVQRLQLKRSFDKTVLYGVGSANGHQTRGKVKICIDAKHNNKTMTTEALCLSNLTQNLPSYEVTDHKLNYFTMIDMADPSFYKPGKVDIILGADVFANCLLSDKLTHPSGSPTAIHTIFGWVLIGQTSSSCEEHLTTAHVSFTDLSQQLQRFWVVEDIRGPTEHLTVEEKRAEDHFKKHVQRDESGRYIVRLPLKVDNLDLGDSRTAAVVRLNAMERRFRNDTWLQQEYKRFMHEYLELGHMEPSSDSEPDRIYFLPHHAVIKPTSTTTKLRVVFDASCKTTSGLSLNDQMLEGPTLQRDLFDIIINFRKFEVGFSGDIEKMYRQIIVHPKDRSLQKILWRNSKDDQPIEYNLRTVTYGTSAAPFLAVRTLQHIAHAHCQKYPEAAAAIIKNFYMACAISEPTAIKLKKQICEILSNAGFHLRKWSSKFLEGINAQDRETSSDTIIDNTQTVNTLGLLWETSSDTFKYSVTLPAQAKPITKRTVLSNIARIFDPIGWLSHFSTS